MLRAIFAVLAFILLQLAGCESPEPVPPAPPPVPSTPPPVPSTFDRAWAAALGGAQDAGVKITSADPAAQLIRGSKDGIDVSVVVARQADGSVRVQFDAKGPTERDPSLADRFSRAYERRMGR